MLLLNCRSKYYEGMFDGRTTKFEPFEMKFIQDRVEGSHLYLKGMPYGLIDVTEPRLEHEKLFFEKDGKKTVNPAFSKFFTQGLINLRKTLDGVVGQYRAMNKEREAAKMARELPSENIIECVKELNWIDNYLKIANADDYALVDRYLNLGAEKETDDSIKAADTDISQDSTSTKLSNRGTYDKPKGKAGTLKRAA